MIGMATSHAVANRRKATPKAPKPDKAAAVHQRGRTVIHGRDRVAEMLRELQVDGKALSLRIQRLSGRFL
jgi:hypothetical protein